MSKPPEPWCGGGYYEAQLRYRFQCFESEPWFKQIVIAYDRAQDKDDEWGAEEIRKSLEETAAQRGIKVRARECNYCEEPKESVTSGAPSCTECLAEREVEREKRKHEQEVWERLSPEERENARKLTRMILEGIITRDVQ